MGFRINYCQLLLIVYLLVNASARAQDENADKRIAEAMIKARTLINFRYADQPLTPHSVLTTSNPTRGVGSQGTMMLWLNQGRPLVAVSIYMWEGKVSHEIDSLARDARIRGETSTGQTWAPKSIGIAFRSLQEGKAYEASATRRLLQMKELAKEFQVTMLGFNDQNSDREQLRMLSTPVYRYALQDIQQTNLVDGAVFAFVQGTDPEALLIIEAYKNDQKINWEYAIVRSTAGALEAQRKGVKVFNAEKFPVNSDPSKPHFTFEHSVPDILGN